MLCSEIKNGLGRDALKVFCLLHGVLAAVERRNVEVRALLNSK